jgi:hypothetical protein
MCRLSCSLLGEEELMYKCSFCGLYVKHGIVALNTHREPGGECDQQMDELQDELDEENAS